MKCYLKWTFIFATILVERKTNDREVLRRWTEICYVVSRWYRKCFVSFKFCIQLCISLKMIQLIDNWCCSVLFEETVFKNSLARLDKVRPAYSMVMSGGWECRWTDELMGGFQLRSPKLHRRIAHMLKFCICLTMKLFN